jgi:Domain of unknown function (DUF1996)
VVSDDHKGHVAISSRIQKGDCPVNFSVRLPFLFYETVWNIQRFHNVPGTFVLANGDERGFEYHGDFMSGWNKSLLQQAIDVCANNSGRLEDCPALQLLDVTDTTRCKFTMPDCFKTEDVRGPRQSLPGNVTISSYTALNEGSANSSLRPRQANSVHGNLTDSSYHYLGRESAV